MSTRPPVRTPDIWAGTAATEQRQEHGSRMVPLIVPAGTVSTGWVAIPGPCRAVGLSGTLPPGVVLVAVDMGTYGTVKDSLTAIPNLAELVSACDRVGTSVFDAGAALVRRGQVHDFQKTLDGVAVALIWPYANGGHEATLHNLQQLPVEIWGQADVPRISALAVVYSESPGTAEVPFTPGVIVYKRAVQDVALVNTTLDVEFPPDAKTVLLQFTDNAADAEIVGAETGDFEIHWATLSGSSVVMFAHVHADDFDGAGLGSVTRLNNAALYPIPDGVVGMTVIQPATAAAFWLFFHVR